MFKKSLLKLVTAICTFCLPPLMAHHQFSSEFDATKPVTLTGKVHGVTWSEPHVEFMVDAQGGSWKVEGASPATLKSHKFTNKELKDGETVTVQGFRAKDGSMTASGRTMTVNGKTYTIADSKEDGGPANVAAAPKPKK
jgi:hypothetical protein